MSSGAISRCGSSLENRGHIGQDRLQRNVGSRLKDNDLAAITRIFKTKGRVGTDSDAKTAHNLTGRQLAWTPDSKGIVVSEREAESDPNALFLVTLGSGRKRMLTSPPSGFNGDADPAFSPDGRILSFSPC